MEEAPESYKDVTEVVNSATLLDIQEGRQAAARRGCERFVRVLM